MIEGTSSSQSEQWLPLMEYAQRTGLSLSTLRRYIKAQKVPFKTNAGKYYIRWEEGRALDASPQELQIPSHVAQAISDLTQVQSSVRTLQVQLQKAHEEIAELKTLIALYAERLPRRSSR